MTINNCIISSFFIHKHNSCLNAGFDNGTLSRCPAHKLLCYKPFVHRRHVFSKGTNLAGFDNANQRDVLSTYIYVPSTYLVLLSVFREHFIHIIAFVFCLYILGVLFTCTSPTVAI
uniref:Transmembrane protein n=1 Tax=Steinernema glaseri TaxID=37863 RepID=A0A1I8ACB2_9BILA